jgi:hypothetical protein
VKSFIRRLWPTNRGTVRKAKVTPRSRLSFEHLEVRDVPASISFSNGIITIHGDAANNVALVSQAGTQIHAKIDNVQASYNAASVNKIRFYGGTGNAKFTNDTAIPCKAYAGTGNDSLIGGGGHDALYGGPGNDTLVAINGKGTDQLYAGTGTDTFWYDTGDTVHGAVAGDHLHCVSGFMSYRIPNGQGGYVTLPVGAQLNSGNLAVPVVSTSGDYPWNYSNYPLFEPNGPQPTDIHEGAVGDCYFLAKLAAMAKANPDSVRQLVTELGDGTYAVNFHNANGQDVFVRVGGDLWSSGVPFNPTPIYAQLGNGGAVWVPIVEKAYAFFKNDQGTYASINGGGSPGVDPVVALGYKEVIHSWLAFKKPTDAANGIDYLNAIQADLAAGKAVTIGGPAGWSSNSDVNNPANFHRGQHIFMVDSVVTDLFGDPMGITLYDLYGNYRTIMGPGLVFHCSGGFASFKV